MGMERVKNHFETAAEDFDLTIQKLIPCYDELIGALISAVPFAPDFGFKVMDLGCGTGTVLKRLLESYPNAQAVCLDISDKMLQMAKTKLGGRAEYVEANFERYEFPGAFDLMVSSLALHHLETEEKLLRFYGRIYNALNAGGVFINMDLVLGGDEQLQEIYMKKWVEFLQSRLDPEEVRKVLADYHAEDRPVPLVRHLKLLEGCGFACVDTTYKIYNFATIVAKK